ncbi:MAG: NAD(P)-dependent oxidoreductase [Balneolaceae bacterium]|nr:NAD(P)-dependent oxidoreductase [Balneolaceae bacterium]
MKIVVDRQLLDGIQKVIAPNVTCIPLEEYALENHRPFVDGFIIRSVTRIDKETYPEWIDSPPSFVITATAGIDHIDTEWLTALGIHWRHCPGANAHAVAEYVIASVLWMSQGSFQGSLGIVGVGATGQAVESLAKELGWDVVLYDPPRARAAQDFGREMQPAGPFRSSTMDDIMACDAVTFHVPRVIGSEDATMPLWSHEELQNAKTFWIIQASRGGTIDEDALYHWAKRGGQLACDVWHGEPSIRLDLLEAATLATPHIAGYSIQSRLNVFAQVTKHLESLGVPVQVPKQANQAGEVSPVTLSDDVTSAKELIEAIHPWMARSAVFKAAMLEGHSHPLGQSQYDDQFHDGPFAENDGPFTEAKPHHREGLFKQWRTQTPLRTEFRRIYASEPLHTTYPWLMKIGVQKAS